MKAPVLILLIFMLLLPEAELFCAEYQFRQYTIENGLSQSTINCMSQDSSGYMWFGTQDGLNKFNGYNFTVFRPSLKNRYSINAIDIWSIHHSGSDSGKVLWLGTHAGGLNMLDLVSGKFYNSDNQPFFPRSKESKNILLVRSSELHGYKILLILQLDGTLEIRWLRPDWYRRIRAGENPWLRKQSFDSDFIGRPGVEAKGFKYILEDHVPGRSNEKTFWIGTSYGGIYLLGARSQISENLPGSDLALEKLKFTDQAGEPLHDKIITSLHLQGKKEGEKILWVGTQDGLYNCEIRYPAEGIPVAQQLKEFKPLAGRPGSLAGNEIYGIVEDRNQRVWIGTYQGLSVVKYAKNGQVYFENCRAQPGIPGSLSEDHIQSLLVDKAGAVWAGTHGNGLNIYDTYAQKFSKISTGPSSPFRLSDDNIKAIFEDPEENVLWVGTHLGGLNRLDLDKNTCTVFKNKTTNPGGISHNRIIKIFQDNLGNLWLGTYKGGLMKFDKNSGQCRKFINDPDDPFSLRDNDVNSILQFKDGRLVIGTYGGGLNILNPKNGRFEIICHDNNDPSSLSSDLVRVLFRDSNNKIWVGSEGGLSQMIFDDFGKPRFINYSHRDGDSATLSENHIYCLYESRKIFPGQIWIGTEGGGLNRFDPESGVFRSYTTDDGLPNNVVYGILEDNAGSLWISTNNGLCNFDPDKMTFRHFTVQDGLPSNEFNFGAYCKSRNGLMYFGGIKGIAFFDPGELHPNPFRAPVKLVSLAILGKTIEPDGTVLQNEIDFTNEITLSASEKIFTLEFASLHYYSPERNKYVYRLDGFDQNWKLADAGRRYVTYTNLDAGDYLFRLKGSNNDGVWNPHETRLRIRILPPFWETWWFRLLGIVLLAALLYLFHRYRLASLLELERMRTRIASDLHDDIGSTLTKIAINSEIIQSTDDARKIKEASGKIGGMSREIIHSMADIIWSIDSRNDTLGDLVDRMRDFSSELLLERNISLLFNTGNLISEKKIAIQLKQNIFLIFKEAIHNIVKHARAKNVNVDFSVKGGKFLLCIKDDGKGLGNEYSAGGNGLKNMRLRAERIQCELTIEDNSGTCICLSGKLI